MEVKSEPAKPMPSETKRFKTEKHVKSKGTIGKGSKFNDPGRATRVAEAMKEFQGIDKAKAKNNYEMYGGF